MKKKWMSLILVVLLVFVFAGCSGQSSDKGADGGGEKEGAKEKDGFTIGVAMKTLNDQFPAAILDAMKKKADELGVKLVTTDGQADVSKQLQQVEDLIAQQVDLIILNPQDASALGAAVEAAKNAGIPVVEVNTKTDNSDYVSFVGSDDVDAGEIQANFIKEKIGEEGKVAVMYGVMGQSPQINREKGVLNILEGTKIKILASQTAEWQRDKALSLAENWILQFPDMKAIMCQNDDMALGAMEAVMNAKKQDQILVVGVDAIEGALESVKKEQMACTIFQDAAGQGQGAVETALKILNGETVEKEVMIPFQLVTKDNVDQFKG